MNCKITRMKPFGVMVEPNGPSHVSEVDVEFLRKLFGQEQLVLLRGFTAFQTSEDFSDYCASWGEVSIWPFGKVLELIERENPEDHIFDNNYVPLHWDGMYRPQVPEYQIFHCVKAPLARQGGRTTFSNTSLVLQNASAEQKTAWSKITGSYQRKMEFYNSKTVSPVITKHPLKGFPVIRYNEPPSQDQGHFVNPPILEFTGATEDFHQELTAALYSPKNFYAHEWRAGDVVIADNFTLLHGRERFTTKAPRHLQRVHVLSDPPLDNPGLESYR